MSYRRDSKIRSFFFRLFLLTLPVLVIAIFLACTYVCSAYFAARSEVDMFCNARISRIYPPAEDFGIAPEEVWPDSFGGTSLHGYLVMPKSPSALVLLLPDTFECAESMYLHAAVLQSRGYASLCLDMRGRGQSEGDGIGLGYLEIDDIRGALSWASIDKRLRSLQVYILGVGGGGSTALAAAKDLENVSGIVTVGAYASIPRLFLENEDRNILRRVQEFCINMAIDSRVGSRYSSRTPEGSLGTVTTPVLLIHGREDREIPFSHAEELQKRLSYNRKFEFLPFDNAGHTLWLSDLDPQTMDEKYLDSITSFFDKYIQGS